MIEIRIIPGFAGYLATSEGEIYSLRKSPLRRVGHIGPYGYEVVVVGKARTVSSHRLVCLAFHGDPPSADMDVRHLNGTKLDNRPSNLTWGTRSENEADKILHGTSNMGERNGTAKLTASTVRKIRKMRARGATYRACADSFGISESNARMIIKRATWKHV